MKTQNIPELLVPAGSRASLEAAIEAGADAVYLGGASFNARAGAQNFDGEGLAEAVALCHAYGIKVYAALNTLVFDRELYSVLSYAEFLYRCGVDALIVADLGLSSLIRRYLPDLPLHASTQMSAHNSDAGHILKEYGFSRMVCARELSYDNIKSIVQSSPIEIEIFVHGALCVSHSGQCLASAMIGQRSGNRGECAQPCRLPWQGSAAKRTERYPLSLRDLCLAGQIDKLLQIGVTSLKIEGRMKSPEYVYHVVSTYRRLLDERRNASPEEIRWLARVFSRDGFTDRYFTAKPDITMLGIRTEENKQKSRSIPPFEGLRRKIPITFDAVLSVGEPARLRATVRDRFVEVFGDTVETAVNAPLAKETVIRCLSKLGQTPYSVNKDNINISLDGGSMLRISSLNALRRAAIEQLIKTDEKRTNFKLPPLSEKEILSLSNNPVNEGRQASVKTAQFMSPAQIPPEAVSYFDIIYLPLETYITAPDNLYKGVILPPVIFNDEIRQVSKMLKSAVQKGATHALVGNLGHLSLARCHKLICHGDFRLNITNSLSAKEAVEAGFTDVTLSPELSLPQIRDIPFPKSTIIYGRVPLMLLEKCVIKDNASCTLCADGSFELTDRRGIKFPVVRSFKHRNVLLNSVPVYMADRVELLIKYNIGAHHFIFTTETNAECQEIIRAYKKGLPPKAGTHNIRRLHT